MTRIIIRLRRVRKVSQIAFLSLSGAFALGGCQGESTSQGVQSERINQEIYGLQSEKVRTACGVRYVSREDSDGDADDSGSNPALNDCRNRKKPCASIQYAIDHACSGDSVHVGQGAYRENVVINKPLTLSGSRHRTVIYPAKSSPNPCMATSLCDGAASSIVLVQANDVTIHDLTLDGDNPDLTSGVVRNGADIDARNGIITNYKAGTFTDLGVYEVTVRNVYLRGIDATGGTFRFQENLVHNVVGDESSIGIFSFDGAGEMSKNHVFDTNDAISANHSHGISFSHNRVQRSGSGIHTDNAGDGASSTADLIEGNHVSDCSANGYGIWVFVPFVAPTVNSNKVHGCAVGLAAFGQGAPVITEFRDNSIDGEGIPNSIGVFVTTDQLGYGSANVSASFFGNSIRDNAVGVYLAQQSGFVTDANLTCNSISHNTRGVFSVTSSGSLHSNAIVGNTTAGIDGSAISSGSLNAQENWWGCASGPVGGDPHCDTVIGSVDALSPAPSKPACLLE